MSKTKSYVPITFKKIRLVNGLYEGTKSKTMDVSEYEEYSQLKHPHTFEELYYATMIQDIDFKMSRELVEHELVKLIVGKLEPGRLPSYDIAFRLGDYKTAINLFIKKYESFRKFLNVGDFDYSLLPETLEADDGLVILRKHFDLLNELYEALRDKECRGLLHIIIGAPGTGKTQFVSESIRKLFVNSTDEVKVITLSNLAGNNMKARLRRNDVKNITCSSYAREHIVGDDKYYKAVVFEEASMLSLAEVPIMLKAITHSKHCYITGDCNQLPGFLGLGNILYAVTSEFGIEKELVKNYRCSQEVVDCMNHILSGRLPNILPTNSLFDVLTELIKQDANFTITCFTNAMMEKLNIAAMCVKLKTDPLPYLQANNKADALLSLTDKFLCQFKQMPCRCKKQITIENEGKYEKLFFTSERGIAHLLDSGRIRVISVDVPEHNYEFDSIEKFLWSFEPGYSCTIHRAQGLEWDYAILWNDMNDYTRNSNACYVAYTRSRKKSIILSDDNRSGRAIEYKNIFRFVKMKNLIKED